MVVVNLAAVAHLVVLVAVGAGLGLERGLYMRDAGAELARHLLEHVVLGDAQETLPDLQRHVPVAEVVGDAREFRRLDVQELFGRGDDLDLAAVGRGDAVAAAAMGDPNASIPTPQPVHYRPMFGAKSVTFVSKAALKNSSLRKVKKPLVAVKNTRKLGKKHMVHNDYLPEMSVDPETYEVRADGELLVCEPAKVLPMAQRYFLF